MMAALALLMVVATTQGIDPDTGRRSTPLHDEAVLTLSADRDSYYRGERMRLELSIENVSDHDLEGVFTPSPVRRIATILYRRPGTAEFESLQCFLEPQGSARPWRTLGPGKKIGPTFSVSLTALERDRRRFLLDTLGSYELKADYRDMPGDPNAVLESNVLTVEVVEAPASEQTAQAAYTPELAYWAQIAHGADVFTTPEEFEAAVAFIDRYQRSRYAGPVREGLVRWLQGLTRTGQATAEQRALYEKLTRKTDTTPPELHAEASPSTLWPPNHDLVQVLTSVSVSDVDDPNPTVRLESITCDDTCVPASDIAGASLGTDDREFELRAERKGSGAGRTYTITYSATDASGNTALATTLVVVPHDQGKK